MNARQSLASQVLPKSVIDGIDRAIDPYIQKRATGGGNCSTKMTHDRRLFYHRIVAELWGLGFQLRKLKNLSARHVEMLMRAWYEQGIVASTLHTRLSMLKVLCHWLGKRGVVCDIESYLPKEAVRRHAIAQTSKAWEEKQINPVQVIAQAVKLNERLAIMLAFQHYFGLRVKESIELKPAHALVEEGTILDIHEGTKGGRPRWIAIQTAEQREVIAWALQVVRKGKTSRLRWPGLTFKQAQSHFYYLVRKKLDISRATAGVTTHGLRHGFAQRLYEAESGYPGPVKGGALGQITRAQHHMASLTVSHALGHGRVDVTSAYNGSYGHALRKTK